MKFKFWKTKQDIILAFLNETAIIKVTFESDGFRRFKKTIEVPFTSSTEKELKEFIKEQVLMINKYKD